jgi:hypothetical protein
LAEFIHATQARLCPLLCATAVRAGFAQHGIGTAAASAVTLNDLVKAERSDYFDVGVSARDQGGDGLIGSSLLIPTTGFAAAGLPATARPQFAGSTSSEPKPPKTTEETFVAGFIRYRRTELAPVAAARCQLDSDLMGDLVSGCALLAAGGVVWC